MWTWTWSADAGCSTPSTGSRKLDHYELLGIPYEADKKQIRDAYFDLSKTFHPDTLFRKRLGSYKQKMEAVFRRLTDAYETLGKKRARKEYDAYLSDKIQAAKAIEQLEQGRREAEAIARKVAEAAERAVVEPGEGRGARASDEVPAASSATAGPDAPSDGPSKPAAPPAESTRSPSPEARRRLQELTARRLAAATHRTVPGTSSPPGRPPSGAADCPSSPTESAAPVNRQALLRGLANSLRQAASFTGGIDRVSRYIDEARRAEEAGDLVSAANALRLAQAIAPDRDELRTEHARVQTMVAASLADAYERQASYEERSGRWAAAALSWSKVADGRPGDPKPARRAALALIEANGDLHQARRLAQQAVDQAPDDAKNRMALGRVFLSAGLKLNARRELEAAAKLDPGDEMVKNLLREAKA